LENTQLKSLITEIRQEENEFIDQFWKELKNVEGNYSGTPSEIFDQTGTPSEIFDQTGTSSKIFEQNSTPSEIFDQTGIPSEIFDQTGTLSEIFDQTGTFSKIFDQTGTPSGIILQSSTENFSDLYKKEITTNSNEGKSLKRKVEDISNTFLDSEDFDILFEIEEFEKFPL
jgi:hypothetical protein